MQQFLTETTLPFDLDDVDLGVERRGEPATIDGWSEVRIPGDIRFTPVMICRDYFAVSNLEKDMSPKGGMCLVKGRCSCLACIYNHVLGNIIEEDIRQMFGFYDTSTCTKCYHCFLSFMVNN